MTMHYQTLRDYGKTMTVKGKQEPMNIAVTLVDVVFPSGKVCKNTTHICDIGTVC